MKLGIFLAVLFLICLSVESRRRPPSLTANSHIMRVTRCVIDTMKKDANCPSTCDSDCDVPLTHVNCTSTCVRESDTKPAIKTCVMACKETGNVCNTGTRGENFACRHINMCLCATCVSGCTVEGVCTRTFAGMHPCDSAKR